jgi:hypothetical protein
MNNGTLRTWDITAYIDDQVFTPPDDAKDRYEEAYFRMDIGDELKIDERYHKVIDIIATNRLINNHVFEIRFERTTGPMSDAILKSSTLTPKNMSEDNQDTQIIQINEREIGIMFERDATWGEANLRKGDTVLYYSSALKYKIKHTQFVFMATHPRTYQINHITEVV